MSREQLRLRLAATIRRHSRSLVDHDGEPTLQLLDELAEIVGEHTADATVIKKPAARRSGKPETADLPDIVA